MNRITRAIDAMELQIKHRIDAGLTTAEKVKAMRKSLDMGLPEFAKFQELKSLASTNGTLTLEEAQSVYVLLGTTPETFNSRPVEVKYILTKLFEELLGMRIAARKMALV